MTSTLPSTTAERGRGRIPECYRTIESWPAVDESLLTDPSIRRRYRRLSNGLELYLQYQSLASVEAATGLSHSRFLRLGSGRPHMGPAGLRARHTAPTITAKKADQPSRRPPRRISRRVSQIARGSPAN
jgi:hypothetical protein